MTGLIADLDVVRDDGFRLRASLRIDPGETVAVLGPNGAGKSTLVAALAGLLPIGAGHITLGGEVLDRPATGDFSRPDARDIGVVFQDLLLFPHMTVLDNVAFGLRSRGVRRENAHFRARHWIDAVGLGHLESRKPAGLSGGQLQLVALARALVIEPGLLLLDEPLSALDVTTRTELRRSLAVHLKSFPGPRLLITHDPSEAFVLADRIVVLEEGVVSQRGTAGEIRRRPRTAYAADLVGSNLISGEADSGTVHVDGHLLHIADTEISGKVLVNIHPHSISVHRARPEGSPRNTWSTRIEDQQTWGRVVRLEVGSPLPLTVEVTPAAATDLNLEVGQQIWLAVKATEIGVEPV